MVPIATIVTAAGTALAAIAALISALVALRTMGRAQHARCAPTGHPVSSPGLAGMQGVCGHTLLNKALNLVITHCRSLLVEPSAGYAFERIPKAEVEDLVLEEVPDVTYNDIGGLARQIEQIRDAVELPFLHKELYREYALRPPKGVLLYGPPGCGKTLIAKAVANSLAKKMAEVARRRRAARPSPTSSTSKAPSC